MIGYSTLLIAYGRYPKIPVISEAARLQVQRSYLEHKKSPQDKNSWRLFVDYSKIFSVWVS